MQIGDFIAIFLTIAIASAATAYIIISKKKGKKCIGCPYASSCPSKSSSGCTCKNSKNDD